jgi:hypothetical protein
METAIIIGVVILLLVARGKTIAVTGSDKKTGDVTASIESARNNGGSVQWLNDDELAAEGIQRETVTTMNGEITVRYYGGNLLTAVTQTYTVPDHIPVGAVVNSF